MPTLNEKRRQILVALKQHLDTYHQMPTAQELTAAVGRRSTSAVLEDLGWLVLEGYVRIDSDRQAHIAPEADA